MNNSVALFDDDCSILLRFLPEGSRERHEPVDGSPMLDAALPGPSCQSDRRNHRARAWE